MDVYAQAARQLLNLSARKGSFPESEEMEELGDIVVGLRKICDGYIEKQQKPWYIRGYDSIRISDYFPMDITVEVQNKLTDDTKDASETLSPPFEDYELENYEEYGGLGYGQQSIVINVNERGAERTACIQVEIDPDTGEFQESSLDGWEVMGGE